MEVPAKEQISSVCSLGPAVEKITGLASDSASPTDTWLVKFKPDFDVEGKPMRNGFLKIYIDPSSLSSKSASLQQIAFLRGLNYELDVYTEVTNDFLKYHVAPTYVRAIGAGRGCSYADLLNMLRSHIYARGTSRLLSETQMLDALDRNLYYAWKQAGGRPAIDDIRTPRLGDGYMFSTLRYSMILSESAGDAVKLSDWATSGRFNLTDFWKIMFMTCIGCYGMSLGRMVHNDIHTGNVFIKDLGEVQQYVFSVDGTPIVISTRYLPLIYDYDRAYVERLGDNYLNRFFHRDFCEGYSQCNILVPNKDIIKVFCYLYHGLPTLRSTILGILAPTDTAQRKLEQVYNTGTDMGQTCFLQERNRFSGELLAMPLADYAYMNNCISVIANIYRLIPSESNKYNLDRWGLKNIYCINKANFDRSGKVDIAKQQHELNYLLSIVRPATSRAFKELVKPVTRVTPKRASPMIPARSVKKLKSPTRKRSPALRKRHVTSAKVFHVPTKSVKKLKSPAALRKRPAPALRKPQVKASPRVVKRRAASLKSASPRKRTPTKSAEKLRARRKKYRVSSPKKKTPVEAAWWWPF